MVTFGGLFHSMLQSASDPGALVRHLDRMEVLDAVVSQLRKDLTTSADAMPTPPLGEEAFELLRAAVLIRLEGLSETGANAFGNAMYRVDIPEPHLRRTMARGGLHALAGECVLRALQKVLTRLRYAGRY